MKKNQCEKSPGSASCGECPGETRRVIAIAGNPNVGKSTIFNGLTGMRQHTGNWIGKTVANAQGSCVSGAITYSFVDIPGTYSLMAHSREEEVARNYLCFGGCDGVVVVCDATCLERNLNLTLQILELVPNVVLCVNMMDDAGRKGIRIDLLELSRCLGGVPVIGISARQKKSRNRLLECLDAWEPADVGPRFRVTYAPELEEASGILAGALEAQPGIGLDSRWLSLKLLEGDESLLRELEVHIGTDLLHAEPVRLAQVEAERALKERGMEEADIRDLLVSGLLKKAEQISSRAVTVEDRKSADPDRRLDRILTGRRAGYPLMLALLALVLWITITGANYPSRLLSNALFQVQDHLNELALFLHAPDWLRGVLIFGGFRVLAWVVSVMLPPMAIFFPLFTLLEDSGYLPRVAYNLDRSFQRCRACGKQALTMCMVCIYL